MEMEHGKNWSSHGFWDDDFKDDYYDDDIYKDSGEYDEEVPDEPVDETGYRNTWEILTWIIVALTIILNLFLIGLLIIRRNIRSIINKGKQDLHRVYVIVLSSFTAVILSIAISDLVYGCLVSPFFVENYVHNQWTRSVGFCR